MQVNENTKIESNRLVCVSNNGFQIILQNGKTVQFMPNGEVDFPGNIFASNISSDGRLKKNIKETEINGTNKLMQLNVRQFDWKKDDSHVKQGLIAQELENVDEEYVLKKKITDKDGNVIDNQLYVNELPLISTLIKGFQEQQQTIQKLENEINNIKSQLNIKDVEKVKVMKAKKSNKIQQYDDQEIKKQERGLEPEKDLLMKKNKDGTINLIEKLKGGK